MKCSVKYCSRTVKSKQLCSKHYTQQWRRDNPVQYAYNNLKCNSKRRGKQFDLTFEQFEQFCTETNYIAQKGKHKTSYSIDRRDNDKGYNVDNIRIMTLSENSSKHTKTLQAYYDIEQRKVIATVTQPITLSADKPDDCPF